jgi:hypothetical protein
MTKRRNAAIAALAMLMYMSGISHAQSVENNNAAWEMFASRLAAQIRGGSTDWAGVQPVTVPMAATWNNAETGKYESWVVLGDRMPKWGPSYGTSPTLVSQMYGLFIKSLKLPIPDPGERRAAEAARKRWENKSQELNAAYSKVGEHWNKFDKEQQSLPPNRRTGFDQWFATFDGRTIGGLKVKVSAAGQEYASKIATALKGFGLASDLITNYDNVAFQSEALSPDGVKLAYHTYNITPDLTAWIDEGKRLPASAPPELSFSFTKGSSRTTTSQSWAGGGLSFGIGFLGISANGRTERMSVDSSSDRFNMAFEAKRIQQFTITPGRWFSAALIKTFKDGPFEPDAVIGDPKKLWGPNGTFNLLPTTLVVAYRPKVTATLTASEYHFLKESWSAGGGISIGPFSFGGGGGSTTTTVTFNDATNTVTATNSTDVPQIVAVVSTVLPDMK